MSDKHYVKSQSKKESRQEQARDEPWKPSSSFEIFRGETEKSIAYSGNWKSDKKDKDVS